MVRIQRRLSLAFMLVVAILVFAPRSRAETCGNQGTWSSLPAAPDSLDYHTAIYDPIRQRMWVWGGDSPSSNYSNKLYYFSLDSLIWNSHAIATSPDPNHGSPTGRQGHSAVYDKQKDAMMIFAGQSAGRFRDLGFNNDVWELDLSTLTWQDEAWDTCGLNPTAVPPCRWYQTSVYDSTHSGMITFGGDYDNPSYWNDTFRFTFQSSFPGTATGPWTYVDAPNSLQGTSSACGVLDLANNRMVVFGGRSEGVSSATSQLTLGASPTWTTLTYGGPTARYAHSGVFDTKRKRMVVFAGNSPGGIRSDVWAYSLGPDSTWAELSPSGFGPGKLWAHTAIYDAKNDRMLVFGGYDSTGEETNRTWALSFDHTPPSAVSDLALDYKSVHAVGLTWTSSGDDGATGTACVYDMRFSNTNITSDNFEYASQATGEPTPSVAGSGELMTVSDLAANTNYWFALKTKDNEGNWSDMSNVLTVETLNSLVGAIEATPAELAFAMARGNPASGSATWQLAIPVTMSHKPFQISLVNPAGRLVRTIQNGGLSVGYHEIAWDLTDNGGNRVGAGMYFARLRIGDQMLRSQAVVLP